MAPILYIVVPCYNEQQVLPKTVPLFEDKIEELIRCGKIGSKSRVLFVDDGSKDETFAQIKAYCKNNPLLCGISLSTNKGHQNALLAGLFEALQYCDVSISIDCDGQDDLSAMDKFLEQFSLGYDVVYGVRDNRDSDGLFKRVSAQIFYKLLNNLGADSVYNHADYRLLSKKALLGLFEFHEVNLFLRGLVPLVGYKSTRVYYDRTPRIAGNSHYPLSKMLSFALDGITSLSNKPLRLIAALGMFIAITGFAGAVWTLFQWAIGKTISGWSSTTFAVFFMGGVQLLCLGIIGEYIGKIYLETKKRPRFIIAERTENFDVESC